MGFLDSLGTVLGGFNDVKQIDTDGFDFREKRAAQQFARDREVEMARQADETRDLGMAEDILVGGGEEGDIQPFLSNLDPARRVPALKLLQGRAGERKSALEDMKTQRALNALWLREQGQDRRLGRRLDVTQSEGQANRESREGIASAGRETAETIAEMRTRRGGGSGSGSPGGGGVWRPLTNEQGEIYGFFNNKTLEFSTPDEAMKGGRVSPIPAGERERRSMLQGMLADAEYLEQIAPKHRGSIGKFQGPLEEIKQGWVGGDPEAIDLFSISDNLSDQLLRARSGAQINEQEYARLRKIVPNPRASEDKYFADLRRFRFEMARLMEQRTSGNPGSDPITTPRPTGPIGSRPAPSAGGRGGDVARPKSKAEYDALPAGARYMTPDGRIKVKR